MIVVDASIAVKWAVAEPGRDEALRVLSRADELIAPDLLVAESANVLGKKCKLGEISVRQSDEALKAIQLAIPRFIPSSELAEDALTLAQNLDHPVYDCFYLACAIPAAILVTADDKFGRSYHEPVEWTALVANATRMVAEGRDEHRRYFAAQMSNVTRGLAKLRDSLR